MVIVKNELYSRPKHTEFFLFLYWFYFYIHVHHSLRHCC